jgi:hypothetical protein
MHQMPMMMHQAFNSNIQQMGMPWQNTQNFQPMNQPNGIAFHNRGSPMTQAAQINMYHQPIHIQVIQKQQDPSDTSIPLTTTAPIVIKPHNQQMQQEVQISQGPTPSQQ